MNTKIHNQMSKVFSWVIPGSIALLLWFGTGVLSSTHAQDAGKQEVSKHYSVNKLMLPNGKLINQVIINGPPTPPPGFEVERQAVSLPEPKAAIGVNVLTVPAYNWVFGCAAVSGAMIAGYYDRTGWPYMYTGPTNGGVMPLNNSSWPTWSDGYRTYPNCPLVASKNGVDGRTSRGSIDDYWVQYQSTASDPYITGSWTQHPWADAIGDYMYTSQSTYGNADGATKFSTWGDSTTPFTCNDMATSLFPSVRADGTLGRKLFYNARGYTVTDCYNQQTDNVSTGGFSFAQYKAEIDAGRPVMLNLVGHTVVGVGYDSSSNTIYLHDTWDYLNHTMTWGGSYSGMALQSVSIVNIQANSNLYAYFTGYGLYKYDGSAWSYLHPSNPASMAAGRNLYAYFSGSGLWKYDGSAWSYLHPSNPTSMKAGTNLYAFFSGYGLYKHDGSAWGYLHPSNPASMAGGTNLYASFSGAGLWKYNGTTWTYLHPSNPTSMTAGTNLYAYFNGYGLYKYDTAWSYLHPSNPATMAAGMNLYAFFGGYGLYKHDDTAWSYLHPSNPASMVGGE